MSHTVEVDDDHVLRCDNLLSNVRALYKKGKDAFYAGFAKHLPDLKELYNYRGDYEREHRKSLPPHPLDTIGYLYSSRRKLPNKAWEVDWDAMGRAVAPSTAPSASAGEREDEKDIEHNKGKGTEQEAVEPKGKGKETVKGKEKEKAKEKEKRGKEDKGTGAGGSGKLAKKDQPRPRPIRREGGEGGSNTNAADGAQGYEGPAAARAASSSKPKPTVRIAAAAPVTALPPPTKNAKARVIKSRETVIDSDEELRTTKGKFREKADEEAEEAREKAAKAAKKADKGAPRVSGGGVNEHESGEEAPLDAVRRRTSEKREADAAKRAEEGKEEEAKRVFTVFSKCSMCERLKIPCIWTHSRIHSAREGVKVACDFCKAQKRGCDASGSAALSLNGHLGPYEDELFPGDDLGPAAEGEAGEHPGATKTLGDVFVTLVQDQRNILYQVGRVTEKVNGLSTGIDTSPQHQEGLTEALNQLTNKLAAYEEHRKAWDDERAAFDIERKGWEREREAWACERKEWEEERKRESQQFAAAVTALTASIAALKPPVLAPLSPPPHIPRSHMRIDDDDEDDDEDDEEGGSDTGTKMFERSHLSAIEEESTAGSQRTPEGGSEEDDRGDSVPVGPAAVADDSPTPIQPANDEGGGDPTDRTRKEEAQVGGRPEVGPNEEDGVPDGSTKEGSSTAADTSPAPSDKAVPGPPEPRPRTRSNSRAQGPAAAAAPSSRPPSVQPKKRKQRSSSPLPDPTDAATADPTSKPAKKVKT